MPKKILKKYKLSSVKYNTDLTILDTTLGAIFPSPAGATQTCPIVVTPLVLVRHTRTSQTTIFPILTELTGSCWKEIRIKIRFFLCFFLQCPLQQHFETFKRQFKTDYSSGIMIDSGLSMLVNYWGMWWGLDSCRWSHVFAYMCIEERESYHWNNVQNKLSVMTDPTIKKKFHCNHVSSAGKSNKLDNSFYQMYFYELTFYILNP